MGAAGATNFHWSETARLHLVEAVIKVEEEIRNESNGISKPILKWTRVSRSLPLRLRRHRSYSEDKCKHMFYNLVKVYRHKLAGKITKYSGARLTELVWESLKRREDLLKAPAPTCVRGEGLKVSLKMADEKRRRPPGQSRREMTEPARGWKILRRQENLLKGPTSTQAERLKGPVKNDGLKKRSMNWTETALVQLVEAVIKVEVIMKESGSGRRPSTGKQMGSYTRAANPMRKWDRIAGLLPLNLQAKLRSPSDQKFNNLQCRRKFCQILKAYKDELAGEATSESRLEITKPVWEVLKRREYLLNSRVSIGAENSLKPAESSNGRRSSEGQSMGTSSQPAASFSSEHSNGEVLGFHSNADEKERSDVECHNRSIHTNNAGSSRGHASRSSSEFEDSKYQNQTLSSPRGSVSRSYMVSKDPEDIGKPSPPPGVRTEAQYRERKRYSNSSARPPLSDHSPVYFRSERKSISSGHDEIQDVILHGLLKTLDLEFSHLSSWVQSRSVQVEEKLTHEMRATCETRSRKRSKRSVHHSGEGRATNSCDEIIQTSLTRIFYHQIRDSFQKLRMRLTEELETVLVELAQELLHETHKLYTSPGPSLGIRGSQCYPNIKIVGLPGPGGQSQIKSGSSY